MVIRDEQNSRELVIAADFGTSGVKLAALDRSLSLLATAAEAYPLSLPGPDRAEQQPDDWWQALRRGIAALHDQIPDLRERAVALVPCAQMCGLV